MRYFAVWKTFIVVSEQFTASAINVNILSIKIKVKFTLEQATKTQRGSRDIALLFL